MPKVTVCILTYNHEKYIRKCLQSIVEQETDFIYEVLVGDDFSIDRTRDIINEFAEKYPDVIKPLFHDKNIGAANNYVAVHNSATGQYIAHLDGDDYAMPGKLQAQVNFLDNNIDCSIVFHDMEIYDDENKKFIGFFNEHYKKPISTITDLIKYGTFLCNSSKMYRNIGILDEDVDYQSVLDWYYHILHSRNGNIGFLDQVLGCWRKSSGSISWKNKYNPEGYIKTVEYTLGKALQYTNDIDAVSFGSSRIYYNIAWECFLRKHFKEFTRYMSESGKNGVFTNKVHRLLYLFRHFPSFIYFFRAVKNLIK